MWRGCKSVIFWKKLVHNGNKRGVEGGKKSKKSINMEGGFFFFKISKCDFTFIREMREVTFKFLIKNQHFLQFLTLGLVNSVIDFL